MFDALKRAWAVWVLANMSYGAKLDGTFGYDRSGTTSKKIDSKRTAFTEDMAVRLQRVQIECADALRIIRMMDAPDAFVYADPPYIGSDMGHYDGYGEEDFESLLKVLSEMEGKFLLSSYPSDMRDGFAEANGWHTVEIDAPLSMAARTGTNRRKREMLTANYPISK